MIDIENKVFDTVFRAVKVSFPAIKFYGDYPYVSSEFPCVSLVETDNSVYKNGVVASDIEEYAKLEYEVNVFSNKAQGRKKEAKDIAELIDTSMKGMGFRRTMKSQTPNIDESIFRYTLRYTAVVSKGVQNGQNIVHIIYN